MSTWKQGAVERRDFRHQGDGPEVPPRAPAKKDTRRFCRGKVGVPHDPEQRFAFFSASGKGLCPRMVCRNCGKVTSWLPMAWSHA